MKRLAALVALVLLLVACGKQRAIPSPPRFDRPNRVDFVCVSSGEAVWMVYCVPCSEEQLKTHGRVNGQQVCNPDLGIVGSNPSASLHALVTQSARGEIAAVDLATQTVLDSRRDIPGYTFVTTGVQPIAIAVGKRHPEVTYVADFGSHDIQVIGTNGLVAPAQGSALVQDVPLQVDTADGMVPASPTDMILAPEEDALFVSLPDFGRVLRLPIVRCAPGQKDCREGTIDEKGIATILVEGSKTRIVPPTPRSRPPYELLCGYDLAEAAPAEVITPSADDLSPSPRPGALALDAFCTRAEGCARRVLVADEALPLIHAVDIDAVVPGSAGGDALLAPLVTGVPTLGVVVTPKVPVSIDSTDETQYVYAIDGTDGTVLVLEDGLVQNVSEDPNGRSDRLGLGYIGPARPWARALSVVTPGFDPRLPIAQQYVHMTPVSPPATAADSMLYCTDTASTLWTPARLRGVFLAVALSDGTLPIVDVFDLELRPNPADKIPDETSKQKGAVKPAPACRTCTGVDKIPQVARHHVRIGASFVPQTGVTQPLLTPTVPTLSFSAQTLTYDVRADGTSGTVEVPGLDCLKCDDDLVSVFPPPASDGTITTPTASASGQSCYEKDAKGNSVAVRPALLCTPDDPWIARESWRAVFDGVLPAAGGGGALLSPPGSPDNLSGAPEVIADLDFCERGVLGDDDIAAEFADVDCTQVQGAPAPPPVHGDQVVITSPLLGKNHFAQLKLDEAGKRRAANCAAANDALRADNTLWLALPIRRAYRDRLIVGRNLSREVGPLRTFDDLESCLHDPNDPQPPLSIEVHVRDQAIVVGGQSGFLHRVRAAADGRCVVDAAGDPRVRGRARMGCTFRNRTLQMRLAPPVPGQALPDPGVTLLIQTSTPATPLMLNATAVGFGGATVVPTALRYSDTNRSLYLVDIQDRGLVPITLEPFPVAVSASATFN